ncbi:LuxR C-terminal-related transcriptional regulator [Nocardia sp. NPDC051900]|uniref:LuxR C-terminal-related transcriptional regulator n=1 Tax=Nocardia sp. NPDC051900 TaxID=3364326 RepID=UPI0037874ADD
MVQIPDYFPDWLTAIVLGHFPEGDPEAMRRDADAWSDAANALVPVLHRVQAAAERLEKAVEGETGTAMQQQYRKIIDQIRAQIEFNNATARQLYDNATAIEYQQYVIIGIAGALLAQVIIDMAMPPPGSIVKAISDRAEAKVGMELAQRDLVLTMLGRAARFVAEHPRLMLATKGVFLGTAVGGGVPYVAQRVQIAQGHRETVDWQKVRIGAAAGAVGGLVGVEVGRRFAPMAIKAGGRVLGTVAAGGVGGMAGGLAGGLTAWGLTGGELRGRDLATMVWTGFGSGLVGSVGASVRAARAGAYTGPPEQVASGDSGRPPDAAPAARISAPGDGQPPQTHTATPEHVSTTSEVDAPRRPNSETGDGSVRRPPELTPEMMAEGEQIFRDLFDNAEGADRDALVSFMRGDGPGQLPDGSGGTTWSAPDHPSGGPSHPWSPSSSGRGGAWPAWGDTGVARSSVAVAAPSEGGPAAPITARQHQISDPQVRPEQRGIDVGTGTRAGTPAFGTEVLVDGTSPYMIEHGRAGDMRLLAPEGTAGNASPETTGPRPAGETLDEGTTTQEGQPLHKVDFDAEFAKLEAELAQNSPSASADTTAPSVEMPIPAADVTPSPAAHTGTDDAVAGHAQSVPDALPAVSAGSDTHNPAAQTSTQSPKADPAPPHASAMPEARNPVAQASASKSAPPSAAATPPAAAAQATTSGTAHTSVPKPPPGPTPPDGAHGSDSTAPYTGFASTDPDTTTPPLAPTAATSQPGDDDEPEAAPEEFPTPPGTVVDDPREHNIQKDPREYSVQQDPREHSVQKMPAGDYVTIPGVSYPLDNEPPADAIPVIPRTPSLTPLPNDSVGLGRLFQIPDDPENPPGPTSPRAPDITNPLSDRHFAAPETGLDAGLGKTPDSLAMPSRYATEPNPETPGTPQKPVAPQLNPHSLEYSEDPSRLPTIGGVPHLLPAPQPEKREGKRLVTRMGGVPGGKSERPKKQPPPSPPPPLEDAKKTPAMVPTPDVRSDAKNPGNGAGHPRDTNQPGQNTNQKKASPPRDFTRVRDGITAAYRQIEGTGELHPVSQALGRMHPRDLAILSQLSPLVRRRVIDVVSAVEKGQELSPLQSDAIKAFVRLLPMEPLDSTGTLTDLEFTELRLVAEDKSLREIGVLIGLKETTVRAHLVRIEHKLGAEDRVTAVVLAIRKGILRQTLDERADRTRSPLPVLTQRETEVLALVAEGASSPEIATQLDISVAAVDSLVERAGEKLGSSTRAGTVAVAVSTGVLPRTAPGGDSGQSLPGLTQREIEVVTLIAKGKTSAEIADDLGLTSQTVESYASRINRKLGANTRAGSVAIVIRTGVIPPIEATASGGTARPELTPREREVLELVAKGENDTEIAAALGLTRQSAKTYVFNINQKFGTHHRAGMAAFALRTGNLPLTDTAPVVPAEKTAGGGSHGGRRPTRPHGAVDSYYDADPAAALGLSPRGYPGAASYVPRDVPRWAMGFNRNPDTGAEWGDASESSGHPEPVEEVPGQPAESSKIGSSAIRDSDASALPRSVIVGLAARLYEAHGNGTTSTADSPSFYALPSEAQAGYVHDAEVALTVVFGALRSGADIRDDDFLERASSKMHDDWLRRNWHEATPQQRLPYDDPGFPAEQREPHRDVVRVAREFVLSERARADSTDGSEIDPYELCTTGPEIAAVLRRRQHVDVVGFGLPDVPIELLREFARTIDELLTKYPHVQLQQVGIGPTSSRDRLFAMSDNVVGSDTIYPHTRSLMLSEALLTYPEMLYPAWTSMINAGKAVGAPDQPVRGLLLREFAYALNVTGGLAAQRQAPSVLAKHYGSTVEQMVAWRDQQFRAYGQDQEGQFDSAKSISGAFAATAYNRSTAEVTEQMLHDLLIRTAEKSAEEHRKRHNLAMEYHPVSPAEQQAKLDGIAATQAEHGIRLVGFDNPGLSLDTMLQIVAAALHMNAKFRVLDVSQIEMAPLDVDTLAQESADGGVVFNEVWATAPAAAYADAVRQVASGRMRGHPHRWFYSIGIHEMTHLLRRLLPGSGSDAYSAVSAHYADIYGLTNFDELIRVLRALLSSYSFTGDNTLAPEEAEAEAVVAVEDPGPPPTEPERVMHQNLVALSEAEFQRREALRQGDETARPPTIGGPGTQPTATPVRHDPVRPEDALDVHRPNRTGGQRTDPGMMNAFGDKVGPEAWAFKKPGQGGAPNRAPDKEGIRENESETTSSDHGQEAPARPALVRAARNGDGVAFDRLRADLADPIVRWMSTKTDGDRAAAERLTDEVFARAATGIGQLREGQDIEQWLGVIARNILVEHRRYERLRDGIWASYAGPRNAESGPRGGLLAEADRATVLRAVHRLPSDHRKVLVWRFEQDKTATQIAASMPSSWGSRTVRSVERRAAQRVVEVVAAELGVVVGGRSAERQQQWRTVQEANPGELERHIHMLPERQREIAGLLLRTASHRKAAKALGISPRQLRDTLYQQIVPALATLLTGGVLLTDHEAVMLTRAAQRHDPAVLAPYVSGLDPIHRETFEQFFMRRRTVNEMAATRGIKPKTIYMRVYRVAQFMAQKVPGELRESYVSRGLLQAATARDVAREAGVSQSTAEKVLRGAGIFAPETRRRVLEAADRQGVTFAQREGVAPPLRVVGPADQYRYLGGDSGYRMTRYEAHVLFESAVRSGNPTVGDFVVRIPDATAADGRPFLPEHRLWQMMPPHVQRFRKVLHLLTDVRLPDGRVLDSSTPVFVEQRPPGAVPSDFQFDRLRAMVLRSVEGLRRALGEVPVEPLRQWLPEFPEDRDTEGFLRFLAAEWTDQFALNRQAGWAEMFTDLEIPGRDPFAAVLETAIFMIPARFEVLHGRLGRENIWIDRGRITGITGWAGALIGDPAFDWAGLNHRGTGDYVPSRLRPPNTTIYESLLDVRHVIHGAMELAAQREPDPNRIAEYAASYTVARRLWGLPTRNTGLLRDIFEAQCRRLAAQDAAPTESRSGRPENSKIVRRQTPWSGDAPSPQPGSSPRVQYKPSRPTPWHRSTSPTRTPATQNAPIDGTASPADHTASTDDSAPQPQQRVEGGPSTGRRTGASDDADRRRKPATARPKGLIGGVPDLMNPFDDRGAPWDRGGPVPRHKRMARLAEPHADGGGWPRGGGQSDPAKEATGAVLGDALTGEGQPSGTAPQLSPGKAAADGGDERDTRAEWLTEQLKKAAGQARERAWNTLQERTNGLPFGPEDVLSGSYRRYLDDPVKWREFEASTSGSTATDRMSLIATLEQAAAKHHAAGLPINVGTGPLVMREMPILARPEDFTPAEAGAIVADVIETQLLGRQAIWASGKLPIEFHGFDRWALTATPDSRPPGLTVNTTMNCIKLALYGGVLGHVLDRDYLRSYIRFEWWNGRVVPEPGGTQMLWQDGSEITPDESSQHGNLSLLFLAPHGLREYHADGSNISLPQRGDLVFFNGLGHVAVATGQLGVDGSPELFTFWPYHSWPMLETVRVSTVDAEIAQLTDNPTAPNDDAVHVEFGPGPWGRGGQRYEAELQDWLRRHAPDTAIRSEDRSMSMRSHDSTDQPPAGPAPSAQTPGGDSSAGPARNPVADRAPAKQLPPGGIPENRAAFGLDALGPGAWENQLDVVPQPPEQPFGPIHVKGPNPEGWGIGGRPDRQAEPQAGNSADANPSVDRTGPDAPNEIDPATTTRSPSTPAPRGIYNPSDAEATMAARHLITDVDFPEKGYTSSVVRKMLSSDGKINIYKPEAGADKEAESANPELDTYTANEVAAYRFSEIVGFGRIPATARTEGVSGPKDRSGPGMIQQFIDSTPGEAIDKYSVVQQQQAAVIDATIGMMDRRGNWRTVKRGDHRDLVLIDHAWSFPASTDPFDIEIDSPFVAAHKGEQHPLEPEVLEAMRNVDTNHLRAAFEDAGMHPSSADGAVARFVRIRDLGYIPDDIKTATDGNPVESPVPIEAAWPQRRRGESHEQFTGRIDRALEAEQAAQDEAREQPEPPRDVRGYSLGLPWRKPRQPKRPGRNRGPGTWFAIDPDLPPDADAHATGPQKPPAAH